MKKGIRLATLNRYWYHLYRGEIKETDIRVLYDIDGRCNHDSGQWLVPGGENKEWVHIWGMEPQFKVLEINKETNTNDLRDIPFVNKWRIWDGTKQFFLYANSTPFNKDCAIIPKSVEIFDLAIISEYLLKKYFTEEEIKNAIKLVIAVHKQGGEANIITEEEYNRRKSEFYEPAATTYGWPLNYKEKIDIYDGIDYGIEWIEGEGNRLKTWNDGYVDSTVANIKVTQKDIDLFDNKLTEDNLYKYKYNMSKSIIKADGVTEDGYMLRIFYDKVPSENAYEIIFNFEQENGTYEHHPLYSDTEIKFTRLIENYPVDYNILKNADKEISNLIESFPYYLPGKGYSNYLWEPAHPGTKDKIRSSTDDKKINVYYQLYSKVNVRFTFEHKGEHVDEDIVQVFLIKSTEKNKGYKTDKEYDQKIIDKIEEIENTKKVRGENLYVYRAATKDEDGWKWPHEEYIKEDEEVIIPFVSKEQKFIPYVYTKYFYYDNELFNQIDGIEGKELNSFTNDEKKPIKPGCDNYIIDQEKSILSTAFIDKKKDLYIYFVDSQRELPNEHYLKRIYWIRNNATDWEDFFVFKAERDEILRNKEKGVEGFQQMEETEWSKKGLYVFSDDFLYSNFYLNKLGVNYMIAIHRWRGVPYEKTPRLWDNVYVSPDTAINMPLSISAALVGNFNDTGFCFASFIPTKIEYLGDLNISDDEYIVLARHYKGGDIKERSYYKIIRPYSRAENIESGLKMNSFDNTRLVFFTKIPEHFFDEEREKPIDPRKENPEEPKGPIKEIINTPFFDILNNLDSYKPMETMFIAQGDSLKFELKLPYLYYYKYSITGLGTSKSNARIYVNSRIIFEGELNIDNYYEIDQYNQLINPEDYNYIKNINYEIYLKTGINEIKAVNCKLNWFKVYIYSNRVIV